MAFSINIGKIYFNTELGSIVTEQKLKLKLDSEKLKRMVNTLPPVTMVNSSNSVDPGFRSSYFARPNKTGGYKTTESSLANNKPFGFNRKPKKRPYGQKTSAGYKKPQLKKVRKVNTNPPTDFDLHLKALQENFPKAFPQNTRIPLGSKIRQRVSEALGISNKEANLFLFWYCHGSKYLDNFKVGAPKVDLDGNVVEEVTTQDIKTKNNTFNILQASIQKKKEQELIKTELALKDENGNDKDSSES